MEETATHTGSRPTRDLGWTTVGRLGGIAAFALVTVALGASLDLEDLGVVLFAQTAALFAATLSAAGEHRIATLLFADTTAAQRPAAARAWRASGRNRRFTIGGAAAVALIVALSVAPTPLDGLSSMAIAALVVTAFALGWQLVLIEALRAGGNVRDANLATGRSGGLVTQATFLVLLGAAAVASGSGARTIETIIVLNAAATLVGLVHLAVAYRLLVAGPATTEFTAPDGAFDRPAATVASQLVSTAFLQADMLLAGVFLPAAPLGVYGIARRVAVLLLTPLQILNLAAAPEIARQLQRNTTATLSRLLTRYAAIALGASAITLVIALVAPDAVWRLLADDDPDAARTVLAILAVGNLVNVATGACGSVLVLAGHQAEVARQGLIALAVLALALVVAGLSRSAPWMAAASSAAVAARFVWLAHTVEKRTGVATRATMGARPIQEDPA
ncbi:MAG: lipopolysaccharide biosynthesis protein [Acidimicrobiales bacterium]